MRPDPRLGSEIGHYRIQRVIGRGGMGVVYLAEQVRLNRRVALKVVAEEAGDDDGVPDPFIREAQLAASSTTPTSSRSTTPGRRRAPFSSPCATWRART